LLIADLGLLIDAELLIADLRLLIFKFGPRAQVQMIF
jgi:hypothetical protein